METYTLGVQIDNSDSKTLNRVLKDCLQLQGVVRSNGMNLQVACVSETLDPYLKAAGIRRTPDMHSATYWRVYYSTEQMPEVPDTIADVAFIRLDFGKDASGKLRLDPNFSRQVVYRDVQPIPESVPWNRMPPTGPTFDQNQYDF